MERMPMAKEGLHVNVYKVPGTNVYRADLKLNTSPGGEGITIRGTSECDDRDAMMGSWWSSIKDKLSKAGQALAKARTIAEALLSNPAIAQAFPQYVGPALVALKAMEKAEGNGKLPEVKKQLTDPTLKKLAREMDELSTEKRQAMSGGGICLAAGPSRGNRRAMMGSHSSLHMPHGGWPGSAFGLPSGNPHPFSSDVRRKMLAQQFKDPEFLQRLAKMTAYQRRFAKNMR